ncbi:MAG TPA: cysteine desulfurase family protein [Chlamydiales bacterium]|nr:cysteine desulfurase family protein [Chlamydiales bacterium]
MEKIYFDNNSTTALDPRVFKAMLEDFEGPSSNPSSMHWFGQQAKQKLLAARQTAASFFHTAVDEITFTSCGTESINLMLRGLKKKNHLITSVIEHSSMYRTIQSLETLGMEVTYLPVGVWGAPLPEQIENAIRSDTTAIALTAANGETGVKIDIAAIAKIAEKRGIPLLLDYVAYVGKEPFEMYPGISAIAVSGHKFHAPKGVGLLFHRSFLKLDPLITGGSQESNFRAGTENLAGILGFAEALKILMENQTAITSHLHDLRVMFETGLQDSLKNIVINGEGPRISNTSNVAFPGVDGETLLIQLDLAGIAASHGSACASGALEPSRVLSQMGIDRKRARSSLRFSFGRTNTREEVQRAIEIITRILKKIYPK